MDCSLPGSSVYRIFQARLLEWAAISGIAQSRTRLKRLSGGSSSPFLVAPMVKLLSAMQETQVQSLGWVDPLEKEMAAHSNSLAWKIR